MIINNTDAILTKGKITLLNNSYKRNENTHPNKEKIIKITL